MLKLLISLKSVVYINCLAKRVLVILPFTLEKQKFIKGKHFGECTPI